MTKARTSNVTLSFESQKSSKLFMEWFILYGEQGFAYSLNEQELILKTEIIEEKKKIKITIEKDINMD